MDKATRLGWRFHNAGKNEPVQMLLFGIIGDSWDGVTGSDFVREWRDQTASNPDVVMTINSDGGYVSEALGIYNEILQYPGHVTANIIVAQSAAGFIAMAADHRTIAKTGKFQLHDAVIPFFGLLNSGTLEETYAELKPLLEEESQNIAGIYADRAGGSAAEWRARMQANGINGTTYRGAEAVAAGLVDEVMPVRNQEQAQRIAALASPIPGRVAAQVEPTSEATKPVDFKEALEAARLARTSATLQQLLEDQKPLTAALKGVL